MQENGPLVENVIGAGAEDGGYIAVEPEEDEVERQVERYTAPIGMLQALVAWLCPSPTSPGLSSITADDLEEYSVDERKRWSDYRVYCGLMIAKVQEISAQRVLLGQDPLWFEAPTIAQVNAMFLEVRGLVGIPVNTPSGKARQMFKYQWISGLPAMRRHAREDNADDNAEDNVRPARRQRGQQQGVGELLQEQAAEDLL